MSDARTDTSSLFAPPITPLPHTQEPGAKRNLPTEIGEVVVHPVPVDCVLGNWVDTGDCSKTCGGGLREQAKPVLVATDFDGKECDTELNRLVACNEQACPVDCVVGKWTNDGVCDKVRPCDVCDACGGVVSFYMLRA
jgi:hypothetical protein